MNIDRFQEALANCSIEELEKILEAVLKVITPKRRKLVRDNKYLCVGAQVRITRNSKQLREGDIGYILEIYRVKASVMIGSNKWRVPLDMIQPA